MNTTFSHSALLSFQQWLDNYLLQKGQAYKNVTSRLYYQYDPRLGPSFATFVAPFRSLVCDSGVTGASIFDSVSGYFFNASEYVNTTGTPPYNSVIFPQISIGDDNFTPVEMTFDSGAYISVPTGVAIISGNSVFFPDNISQTGTIRISGTNSTEPSYVTFITDGSATIIHRGQQGAKTDFVRGRLIVPTALVPSSAILSGSYALKEFNVYFANQSQESTIFTNKYYLNSRFNRQPTPPNSTYDYVAPCIFISNVGEENQRWGLGGVYNTVLHARLSVVAENLEQLEDSLAFICDAKHLTFPILSAADSPLNFYGDYKSGYNYEQTKANYSLDQPMMITSAQSYKLSDATKANNSLFFGGVDLTLERTRTLR